MCDAHEVDRSLDKQVVIHCGVAIRQREGGTVVRQVHAQCIFHRGETAFGPGRRLSPGCAQAREVSHALDHSATVRVLPTSLVRSC